MKHREDKFIHRESKSIFNCIWDWELGLNPNGLDGIRGVMEMFQSQIVVMVVQPYEFIGNYCTLI